MSSNTSRPASQLGITTENPTSSPLSENKPDDDMEKAKQWTYYIETLNRTIDCIYEICLKEHTVSGCKEALLYLSSSVRDFESLIKAIELEVAWEEEGNKRHAVAWEIRKGITPTGKPKVEGPKKKDADSLITMLRLLLTYTLSRMCDKNNES
ncbi:unnamed protein product [Thelazia callipaeda]|uniref:SCAPER_N domain-containing protein n=1 Tax=Thelazia callipaeda TaxID=103827 RepID=A0A0N5CKR7_THECL|nr:unnamed protein product [Thelazia callipaeda]